jgi:hypothetical protein
MGMRMLWTTCMTVGACTRLEGVKVPLFSVKETCSMPQMGQTNRYDEYVISVQYEYITYWFLAVWYIWLRKEKKRKHQHEAIWHDFEPTNFTQESPFSARFVYNKLHHIVCISVIIWWLYVVRYLILLRFMRLKFYRAPNVFEEAKTNSNVFQNEAWFVQMITILVSTVKLIGRWDWIACSICDNQCSIYD